MSIPKKNLLIITGTGTSMGFGFPSTLKMTELIEKSFFSCPLTQKPIGDFYTVIVKNLKKLLVNPGIVTFEDIYQGILNVRTMKNLPKSDAFDEFRPRIAATHNLKRNLKPFSKTDVSSLYEIYLNNLLDTFLNSLNTVSGIETLSTAFNRIKKNFKIWSFTLNYDGFLDNSLKNFENGFNPLKKPKAFNPNRLLNSLNSKRNIHCHLHGSLKWGFPHPPNDPFELYEYETQEEGVKHSIISPSGRPTMRGETFPPSPIITGLDKAELVFKQPFFTNFTTFFKSLDLCSHMLIAGYSFSDRHVNMGIERCRKHRSMVPTFIVDKIDEDHPFFYFGDKISGDAWHTILPGDTNLAKKYSGWWKIPGISKKSIKTGAIYLWLNGFDTFCKDVIKNGLPKY